MNATEKEARLKLLATRCREEKLPVTVQRRAILAALLDRDDHPTIDQIYDDVRNSIPGVSRTTVYRVLETLVGLGMAKRTYNPESLTRFDGNTDHHHHLVCIRCHDVLDFTDSALGELPLPEADAAGFEIHDFSVYVEGICARCGRRASAPERQKGVPPGTTKRR